MVEKVSEEVIYKSLEYSWGIDEAEGHDQVFEVTKRCIKIFHSSPSNSNSDQVVSISPDQPVKVIAP